MALKGVLSIFHHHPIYLVHFFKFNIYLAPGGELDLLADVVGRYGKFPPAAVDQDGQVDELRAAQVDQVIDGGAHGPAGVQDVIHQDNRFIGDVEWDARVVHPAFGQERIEIVAVERNVHLAHRHFPPLALLDHLAQPLGEIDAARPDADKGELLRTLMLAQDLPAKALQALPDLLRIQDFFAVSFLHWRHASPFPAGSGPPGRYLPDRSIPTGCG